MIDTEGLFEMGNNNGQDCDTKLVLFCLAVSDLVIINAKRNLDNNTEKILRICCEKLEEHEFVGDKRPEFAVVLNHNNI